MTMISEPEYSPANDEFPMLETRNSITDVAKTAREFVPANICDYPRAQKAYDAPNLKPNHLAQPKVA